MTAPAEVQAATTSGPELPKTLPVQALLPLTTEPIRAAQAELSPPAKTTEPAKTPESNAASVVQENHAASTQPRETSSKVGSRLLPAASVSFANRHRPKLVKCFYCEQENEASYAAKLVPCTNCGAEIDLSDHTINRETQQVILTRGSVTINKLGSLEGERLICHNLKAYGKVDSEITCTGDLMLKSSAKLPGNLHCQQLIIGQGVSVQVEGGVYASEMEVAGEITATELQCTGQVLIREQGAINGPLQTRSVSMEDGGCLNGTLQIVRAK